MRLTIFCLFCFLSSSIFSAIPAGYWQCIAFDAHENIYMAFGPNMQIALKAADHQCHQYAKLRRTCRTAQSFCEQGPTSLIEDRCVVSDNVGHTWNTTGYNACKTAIDMCNKWQYLNGIQRQCTVKHQ